MLVHRTAVQNRRAPIRYEGCALAPSPSFGDTCCYVFLAVAAAYFAAWFAGALPVGGGAS